MGSSQTRTLWLSILFALIAAFLLNSYTKEKEHSLAKKYSDNVNVVVAKQDINEMQTIDETMLDIEERPAQFAEPGTIKDPLDAIGRIALAPIKAKEQVLESKILEPGPETGLSIKIAPSKRAVTIPIDEMRGVAKLLKPGDRIDLIAALDVGKGTNRERIVKTLLRDVTILATGYNVAYEPPRIHEKVGKSDFIQNLRSYTNFDSITVEVSPDDAQKLVYLLSTSPGSLFVSLRNPSDNMQTLSSDTSLASLLGLVSTRQINNEIRKPITLNSNARRPQARPSPAPQPTPPTPPKKQKSGGSGGGFKDL